MPFPAGRLNVALLEWLLARNFLALSYFILNMLVQLAIYCRIYNNL